MNKVLLGTLAALAVVPATVAMACSFDGKGGIFPENDLYIPAGNSAIYSATKEQFFDAVNKMQTHYEPIFEALGRKYKVIADWDDGTVNAYATQSGKTSNVYMFGGLARHPKVTEDGFMLVICHETGHHLGGAPRSSSWASNEGEADYFATLKCAREIWGDEDNEAVVAKLTIPQVVNERCQKAFDSGKDIAICERAAMAGKSLGDTLGDLGQTGDTDFNTPDTTVVDEMDDEHPEAQCRLDTYFAGAVCNKSKDTPVDARDPTIGACSQEKGDVLGIRPLCWYYPMTKSPDQPSTEDTPSGSSWPSAHVQHHASN
jgi:hypothetical protein